MKEFWLAFYAFWRSLFSPIVWRMFYKRKRYTRDEEARAWCNKFLTSEMTVAHMIIHPVEYKADRLKGKIDASIPPRYAHVFFAELEEVRASVGDSVWDSIWAYVSSLFPNIKKWKYIYHEECVNPFQAGIDLWKGGYVPSFDGKTWRLHTKAGIVWEDDV